MANVLLTEKCVRACPYCFAKKHMADSQDDVLKWEDLIYIADLLETSGEMHISLLGGEPTLHPHFIDFVIYLLERNFHITVFTSGIMNDDKLMDMHRTLCNVPPEKLGFVCNLNNPELASFSENEVVRKFLRLFGHYVSPGFNIYKPDFKLDFLFKYINEFGLKKYIRLGLTHPIPGTKNAYVHIEDMKKMVDTLVSYFPVFERLRLKPGFDCGFPLCLFTDEQLGRFFKLLNGNIKFGCGPAIDIGPDMTVWACFPLSKFHKKSIYEFDSMHQIKQYFDDYHRKVRMESGGIFLECDECRFREEGLCSGGCLAHLVSRFANEAPVRMPDVYN